MELTGCFTVIWLQLLGQTFTCETISASAAEHERWLTDELLDPFLQVANHNPNQHTAQH